MKTTTANTILKRIRAKHRGWVFTPRQFAHLGTRAAVDQALSRLQRTWPYSSSVSGNLRVPEDASPYRRTLTFSGSCCEGNGRENRKPNHGLRGKSCESLGAFNTSPYAECLLDRRTFSHRSDRQPNGVPEARCPFQNDRCGNGSGYRHSGCSVVRERREFTKFPSIPSQNGYRVPSREPLSGSHRLPRPGRSPF